MWVCLDSRFADQPEQKLVRHKQHVEENVAGIHPDFWLCFSDCSSQTLLQQNCLKERAGAAVTQQNLTINTGAGAKTRPLTHPVALPITESLRSKPRPPSSVLCGNSPQ
ncbi:hypothetical protein CHARACLAT_021026 [Characodon lateralis]|uniref:Uncharacterized protein n=1 Tax=Characodon lateralis TaxID=208331 RepID=A0ABU7EY70_9TELE|nr:hypothetical protein [Characodon lateralis]